MALAPWLFTNSSAVMAAMAGLTPLLCVTLVVHTASMATEGMLLAGARPTSVQAREGIAPENASLCMRKVTCIAAEERKLVRLACAWRVKIECVMLPGLVGKQLQGKSWLCALAGRDLRFLIVSYGGNLALTLTCLAAQQRFFAPVTIFGIWGCAWL